MAFAAIRGQPESADPARRSLGGTTDPAPGVIGAAVVDRNDFELFRRIITRGQTLQRLEHPLPLIVGGNDHGTRGKIAIGNRFPRPVEETGKEQNAEKIKHVDRQQTDAQQHRPARNARRKWILKSGNQHIDPDCQQWKRRIFHDAIQQGIYLGNIDPHNSLLSP